MQADVYYDDKGLDVRVEDIPENMKELAQKYHDEDVYKRQERKRSEEGQGSQTP